MFWRTKASKRLARVEQLKRAYRDMTPAKRERYRDRITQASGGFFRNQNVIDMCDAAIEVIREEEAAERTLH